MGEGKKVYQLEYVVEEQLMVVLSGKQRHVRLIPVRALDGDDVEWIKVAETKGCITFATGVMRRAAQLVFCLCVAIKRQVCMGKQEIHVKLLIGKLKGWKLFWKSKHNIELDLT